LKGTAIYSYFGYPMPFQGRLEAVRNAGFTVTAIGLGQEEELVQSGQQDRMVDLTRSEDLVIQYAHAPDTRCNGLWSGSREEEEEAAAEYRSHLSFCGRHEIPLLILHVTQGKGEQPLSPGRRGLDVLKDLVKYAEDLNVAVAIENTQKPFYLDYIFSSMESPYLGLCYDSSHDFLYSPEPLAILRRWGHLLLATHISDNDGILDRHWLPGEGTIPWGRVKDDFPRATFDGYLTLEIFPRQADADPPSVFLERASKSIEWCAAILGYKPENSLGQER
jgi:sugar phosphate isomerase/epimerase